MAARDDRSPDRHDRLRAGYETHEAFTTLGAIAGPAGLYTDPAAAMVALYHDDPESTPAAQLRADAGLLVSDQTQFPASLGEARIPAGSYARTVHRGPYNELGDVWARFMGEWLPALDDAITPLEVMADGWCGPARSDRAVPSNARRRAGARTRASP